MTKHKDNLEAAFTILQNTRNVELYIDSLIAGYDTSTKVGLEKYNKYVPIYQRHKKEVIKEMTKWLEDNDLSEVSPYSPSHRFTSYCNHIRRLCDYSDAELA